MKILHYGSLTFRWGQRGYGLELRGWTLDFEGKTMEGADIIRAVVSHLLEDPNCKKDIVGNYIMLDGN